MRLKNLLGLIMAVALSMGNCPLQAQDFGLEYNTEWQTNFRGDYNWCNLLRLDASVKVTKGLVIQGSTISIAQTCREPLLEDLQGYSNIQEDNLPLTFAVLGAGLNVSRSEIFLGIRNVNEDYFTTPVTSFFVNSSCGIFPTLSANYDIANYPMASWCIYYKIEWDKIKLQTSLYEGRGHKNIVGHNNIFSFSPGSEGIFSITSAEYDNNGSNYSIGCAVYYGMPNSDEDDGELQEASASSQARKKVSVTPWINVEQRLTQRCDLMLQASVSTYREGCKYYLGAGTTFSLPKVQMGLFVDYAKYKGASEIASELTCRIPLSEKLYLQPAVELISTDRQLNTVALLRLNLTL